MAKATKGAKPKAAETSKTSGKGAAKDSKDKDQKRKLGLRGAAPWAARHAAKHAAEARARAAEPPLPGSARATIRIPVGAEDIKQRVGELHNALIQVKGYRKNLNTTFFDIGGILKEIQARRLFEAKGYGSFEAFLEREIDLGKLTSLKLIRVVGIFQKDAALDFGMDRLFSALGALDGELSIPKPDATGKLPLPPVSTTSLPLKPPGRI